MRRRTLLAAVGVGLAGCNGPESRDRLDPDTREPFEAPPPGTDGDAEAIEHAVEPLSADHYAVPVERSRSVDGLAGVLAGDMRCGFLDGGPSCREALESGPVTTAVDREPAGLERAGDSLTLTLEADDGAVSVDPAEWTVHRRADDRWHSLGPLFGRWPPLLVDPAVALTIGTTTGVGIDGRFHDGRFGGLALAGLAPGVYAHRAVAADGTAEVAVVHGIAGTGGGPRPTVDELEIGPAAALPGGSDDPGAVAALVTAGPRSNGRWGRIRARVGDRDGATTLVPDQVRVDPLLAELMPIAASGRFDEVIARTTPHRVFETARWLDHVVGEGPVDVSYLGRAMRLEASF